MVLDGVMLPEVDFQRMDSEMAAALERQLGRFAAACKANKACALNDRDPIGALESLLRKLHAKPLTIQGVREPITSRTLTELVRLVMYAPKDFRKLALLIRDITAAIDSGSDTVPTESANWLTWFAGGAEDSDDGTEHFSEDANVIIHCADIPTERDAAAVLSKAPEAAVKAPHFWRVLSAELPCTVLPKSTDYLAFGESSAAKNLLLVGTAGDGPTPIEWSERFATVLGGTHHLRYEGDGHTALGRSGCVGSSIITFLVDLTPPQASCPASPIPF
jgi:hypothetical protein